MAGSFTFAGRTDWSLEGNKIIKKLNALKARGAAVIDLTESNPTRVGFQYPQIIASALINDKNYQYVPASQGMEQARAVIAGYYRGLNIDVSTEQIFLTSSTSEAYSFLFRLLADPDEEILFPQPSYPLFQFLVDLNDLRLVHYPLEYDGRWGIDLEKLGSAISAKTKAVVLVNPNNPTGSYVTAQELRRLNGLCRDHQLALVSDEVFFDFALDKEGPPLSLAANKENLTFALGGLSKLLGLPQMKLSWIVINGPEKIRKDAIRRLEVIADTYLSVNTPVQNALKEWFSAKEDIQGQIRERIRHNLRTLQEKMAHMDNCSVLSAEGGWYAVLKVPSRYSEEEWVLKLLEDDHVFVHPGFFFDFREEPYLIISLLPEAKVFQEGLKRILQRAV